jgi:pimeloyl-ACP methyl ester carboxylesterase
MKNIFVLLLLFVYCFSYAQDLSRRADWKARIAYPKGVPGAKVLQLENDSPLAKAGVKVGDFILQVDGRLADSGENWTSINYALRAGKPIQLLIKNPQKTFFINVELPALEKESHPNHDTYYESVINDYGIQQRTIITKPANQSGKLPAIFLVQGLSCSTIEKYSSRSNNWVKMINALVERSGHVVMRVDKPGVGDSEGDCATTDFITELSGYRAALRSLKQKEYVDTNRIVVYGASMGSALAPLLANEFRLAGLVSDGTFFKTWFEHMLEIERRIRSMEGDDEATIAKKMNEVFIPLYYGMLVEKKSYGEIIEQYPAIKSHVYHPPAHMYGRPMKYYQQLQDFDLASAWEKLKVPVRILYGENDWIMSAFDNQMIMNVLDRVGHQNHQLHIYPGLDHWNTIHEQPSDSYKGKKGVWDPQLPELVIGWIKEMTGR